MHHLRKHIHQWALINDTLSKSKKTYSTSISRSRSLSKHVCTQRNGCRVLLCQRSQSSPIISADHVWLKHEDKPRPHTHLKNWSLVLASALWCHCLDLKCLSTAINAAWALGHMLYEKVIREQSEWIWYGDDLCFEIIFLHAKIIIRLMRTASSHCACLIYLHFNIFLTSLFSLLK